MIFVDSSAWVALVDARDGNHPRAILQQAELVRGRLGRLVTSDFVLDETFTLVRKRLGPDAVRQFAVGVESSASVHTVWVTPEQFRASKEMFLGQGRRGWSFTDCTSFCLMRELGIGSAFTFDRDFGEAGFECWPK